ncbi:MAG: universal stress protein [Caldilineaceae bacterium]
MYTKILVPLDASMAAEQIIPYLQGMLPRQSEYHLVSVLEPNMYTYAFASSEATVRDKLQGVIYDELAAYLARVQEVLQAKGYHVHTWVARGDAAQTIADVATKIKADLIAMTTHGRTGFTRWALGSVADRVIQVAQQPILLVRLSGEPPLSYAIQRVLVPLDGSALAEAALNEARQVAQERGATLLLVRVVEPLSSWQQALLAESGYDTTHITQERQTEAYLYLKQIQEQLQQVGIASETHIFTGNATETLLQLMQEEAIDLIVMSTHGLSGYSRWVYGSVAGKVLHTATCPLLLARSVEMAGVG